MIAVVHVLLEEDLFDRHRGVVVNLANDVQDGRRDSSAGDLVRSATPFILPLFGAGLLAGIGIGIGLILIVVPGLILATIWSVIAPVIVVASFNTYRLAIFKDSVIDLIGRVTRLSVETVRITEEMRAAAR